jgi:hypothetical protein
MYNTLTCVAKEVRDFNIRHLIAGSWLQCWHVTIQHVDQLTALVEHYRTYD